MTQFDPDPGWIIVGTSVSRRCIMGPEVAPTPDRIVLHRFDSSMTLRRNIDQSNATFRACKRTISPIGATMHKEKSACAVIVVSLRWIALQASANADCSPDAYRFL